MMQSSEEMAWYGQVVFQLEYGQVVVGDARQYLLEIRYNTLHLVFPVRQPGLVMLRMRGSAAEAGLRSTYSQQQLTLIGSNLADF
jgi:hypothetical protein